MPFCSCIPPPASVRAPKVYNVLVPEVFPKQPPVLGDPLPESEKRKIGKLAEYVRLNPAQIPKVSRRLYRKAIKSIGYPGYGGHVVLAAEAYTTLLRQCENENPPYGCTFFIPELLTFEQPLIPMLLEDSRAELRIAGSELLAALLLAQDSTAYAVALVNMISKTCKNALADTDPQEQTAMMQVLLAYVQICKKMGLVPAKLDEIQLAIVKTLATKEPERKPARDVAAAVAEELKDCAKDLSTIHTMIDGLLHQGVSAPGQTMSKLQRALEALSKGLGDHRFTLLSSLLQYVAEPGVPAQDAISTIQAASAEVAQLPDEHAGSILALSLQLLPRTYSPQVRGVSDANNPAAAKDTAAVKAAAQKFVAQLAVRVGSLPVVYSAAYAPAMGGGMGKDLPEAAVLDTALVAIRSMQGKGAAKVLECLQLPPACSSAIATVLTSGDPTLRLLAHATLEPLAGAKALQDPVLATTLQNAAAAEVLLPDAGPKELAAAARLWRACITRQPASFASSAVKAAVKLAKHVSALDPETANVRRACGQLMVVNDVLDTLAQKQTSAASLAEFKLDVQTACPDIKSTPDGLSGFAADFGPTGSKAAKETLAAAQQKINSGPWEEDLLAKGVQASRVENGTGAGSSGRNNMVQMLGGDCSPRHLPLPQVPAPPPSELSSVHIRVLRGESDADQELLDALDGLDGLEPQFSMESQA